jgi:outer membrane protein assembly factor BamB
VISPSLSPFRVARALSVFLLAFAMSAGPATAQLMNGRAIGAPSGRFIEAPRSVEQQLRDARRALEAGDFLEVIVRLGELSATRDDVSGDMDLTGQDFFLNIDRAEANVPLRESLLKSARDMIGQLPADAMETYELRYGPTARKLLTEASQTRDWKKVGDVRRRYFHTQSGYRASWLLAQHEFYNGHPLAASLLLDDVVRSDRAVSELGPGVAVLHAAACRLASRTVPTLQPGDVTIAGEATTIPPMDQQSQWLEERIGALQAFAPESSKDYAMFGGDIARNGGAAGQMPLSNLRWMLGTTASPRQERMVRELTDDLVTAGKLPPPTWTPIRVGDQLLMRTTERLLGVDYKTGKRIWTYPWQSAYEVVNDDEVSFDPMDQEDNPGDLLSQRVWNDVPYGQITSDGRRVFMLDDLAEIEMISMSPVFAMQGTRPADNRSNTLVALDMATEGKLLWRLGKGADESSPLSDAFFLGPPLPIDGRLYVMVEIAGDINLCCLDPSSGEELWRQHLVAVESGGIESDPIRRVAGAVPTYHQGVLICPTGAGAIVAIDLIDRMFRWGVAYDRNNEMMRHIGGRGRQVEPSQLMDRWDNGVAIADGNAILVTPIEADRLFGFDVVDGTSLFPEKNRVQMRYLAGIRDQTFLVVGTNQVRAFALDEAGSAIWTARDVLSAGQQISGRGVFGKDSYFVPTTTNQLVEISLADGSVVAKRNTRYPLGNLVAVDGEMIVQGPTSLAVAYGEAALEPVVNRMLQENPDDFEALVRKSELLIQQGDRNEALQMLGRARGMQPDNDEVHLLSISAMLGLMRDNVDVDPSLVESLDDLIDRPSQRAELLSLQIKAALEKKQYVAAVQRMVDFSSLLISEPTMESIADQILNDPTRHCSLDSWLQSQSRNVREAIDEQQRGDINAMLAAIATERKDATTNVLERTHWHFRDFAGIDPIGDELIRRYQESEDYFRLERMLLETRVDIDQGWNESNQARRIKLAETYADGGLQANAVELLTEADQQPGADVDAVVSRWPKTASLTWESLNTTARFRSADQNVSKTEILTGNAMAGWHLISDSVNPAAVRSPEGLPRVLLIDGGRQGDDADKEAQISGGAMMIMTTSGLICVDIYHLLKSDGEAVRWQRGLSGDTGPVTKRRSDPTPFGDQTVHFYLTSAAASNVIPEFVMGPMLGDRVLLLQGGDLFAVSLTTKETLWRNSAAPLSGAVLSDGNQVAVVSPETAEVIFFDVLDGSKIQSRPWSHGKIWDSIGRHVLCYRPVADSDRYEVSLVDPFTDEVKLSKTLDPNNRTNDIKSSTYGRIVDGKYLAMLQSSGEASVWDLVDGREIGSPTLPPHDDLQGLHAMRLDGQIIFLPKRRIERSSSPVFEQLQTADGATHQTAHGVFAVSLSDGSLRWSTEFDKPWGCTLTQASATPVLMLARSPFTNSIQSRKKYLDVLGLDVRDGTTLVERLGKPILGSNSALETRLTVQPAMDRVIAQIGTELLTLKFGETDPDADTATDSGEAEAGETQPDAPAESP